VLLHTRCFAIGLTVLVLTVSGATQSQTSAIESVQPLELIERLWDKDFEQLAAILDQHQRGVETGALAETSVEAAFMAFAHSEPRLERRLDEWVLADPKAYQGVTARGVYLWNLAVLSRGPRPDFDDDRMLDTVTRRYFERAQIDLRVAIEANPKLTFAHSLLVHIAVQLDERGDIQGLVDTGLRHVPGSLLIQRRYLDSLGLQNVSDGVQLAGALKELERDLRNSTAAAASHLNSSMLVGYPDLIRAENRVIAKQRVSAVEFYDRAVASSDYWLYRLRRGINFYRLGRWQQALTDLDATLSQRPHAARVLSLRARALFALGHVTEAFSSWQSALSLNPYDPLILLHHSFALRDEQRFDDALQSLNHALEFGSRNQHIWDARGRLFLYDKQFFLRATHDLARAIELDPEEPRHRFNYAAALYKDRNCKAPAALGYYLELCAAQACPPDNIAMVTNWHHAFDESQRCELLELERNINREKRGSNEK